MSKQLQQNQTDIYQRLSVYNGQITNLTQQVSFIFMIYDTRLLEHIIIIIDWYLLLFYKLQRVLNVLYFIFNDM